MPKAVSVIFSGSPHEYHYFAGDHDVRPGDNVTVSTKRGDATVIVTAVLDHSDKATATIKSIVGRGELL